MQYCMQGGFDHLIDAHICFNSPIAFPRYQYLYHDWWFWTWYWCQNDINVYKSSSHKFSVTGYLCHLGEPSLKAAHANTSKSTTIPPKSCFFAWDQHIGGVKFLFMHIRHISQHLSSLGSLLIHHPPHTLCGQYSCLGGSKGAFRWDYTEHGKEKGLNKGKCGWGR